MKIQSSWIFFEHPNKKKEKASPAKESIQLGIGFNVYSFITKSFPTLERVAVPKVIFSSQLVGTLYNCNVEFDIHEVGGVQYLDVSVDGESDDSQIECLEKIQNAFLQSGIKEYYIDINSYDAVSEHYCNKIVCDLNSFERNLRKLLFNTYVLYFEDNYYQATMDEKLQDKIKGLIRSSTSKEEINRIRQEYKVSGKQVDAILRLKYFFYSLELADALDFLFASNWTLKDEADKEAFLNKHKDLSMLTDEELRQSFERFSPQSDWERFYAKKIHIDNVKESLETIRKYRNSVAHFKFFSKADYTDCLTLLQELNTAVLEAIEETKTVDFANRNKAILKETLEPILEKWLVFKERLRSQYEESLSTAFKNVIKYIGMSSEPTETIDEEQ